jgi:octaprenyl-diphosphate synthase
VLYGAASELGAFYAGADAEKVRACQVFGTSLGTAFQIIDDCLDVEGEESVVGKSLGTDFGKGKMTLPFLKLYADLDEAGRRRFDEIFEDQNLEGRQEAVIREFDLSAGLSYAHDRADDALREALNSLSGLPNNEYVDALRAMADFVLNRRN